MRNALFILLILCCGKAVAQDGNEHYTDSIITARAVHDSLFTADILDEAERASFKGFCYFPPDETFIVKADFTREKGKKFAMPMTKERDRTVYYRKYGKLTFTVSNQECELFVYENLDLKNKKQFKNYLFLPFRDATSGNISYGGGRFIDIYKSEAETWTIDFNSAYNPYCAYSERYSCPVTPQENTIPVSINAGTCYNGHE